MDRIVNAGIGEMPGISFNCDCGRKHSVDIRRIFLGEGIDGEIREAAEAFRGRKIFLFADNNTYEACGKEVQSLLLDSGHDIRTYIFNGSHPLVPDEKALGRLMVEIERDTGLIVAVGSGSINDLARMASYKMGIPYIIVGTAPSMDGYASTVSPLIIGGSKVTYEAVYPHAILADLRVLRKAPLEMLQAGFGDVLGKYTALADWELSRRTHGEYYCGTSVELVKNALKKCIDNLAGIGGREAEAIGYLTEALILSGIAMGLVGNSRPASGAEHHLAHYWEIYALANGIEHPLHGNSVGVGTVVSASIYELLDERFGVGVEVPKPEFIRELLKKVGSCDNPADLGIKKEVFRESILHAMEIRPRYTVFHLALQKGVLEEVAGILTKRFYD